VSTNQGPSKQLNPEIILFPKLRQPDKHSE